MNCGHFDCSNKHGYHDSTVKIACRSSCRCSSTQTRRPAELRAPFSLLPAHSVTLNAGYHSYANYKFHLFSIISYLTVYACLYLFTQPFLMVNYQLQNIDNQNISQSVTDEGLSEGLPIAEIVEIIYSFTQLLSTYQSLQQQLNSYKLYLKINVI